jgi:hypothetical protein
MYLLGCYLRYPGKYTATMLHSQSECFTCSQQQMIYTQLITDKAYSGIYFIEIILLQRT